MVAFIFDPPRVMSFISNLHVACKREAGARRERPKRPILDTHRCTITEMKKRELEQRLAECGWQFLRRGGKHDVWTDGEREEAIPRHREINEQLARAILRRARKEQS
jgi:mRNA interferase HicA